MRQTPINPWQQTGLQALCVALVVAAACATPVAAQERAPETEKVGDDPAKQGAEQADKAAPPPSPTELLKALNDDDFYVRERAMRQLMNDRSLTPAAVGRLYRRAESFEQQWRLEQVAKHHFVRRLLNSGDSDDEKGVLGITIQGVPAPAEDARAGIRVVATIPGLPAHAKLQPDDLIVAVNGKAIANDAEPALVAKFRDTVLSRKQGETITLDVLRAGEIKSYEIELGRYVDLTRLYGHGADGSMVLNEPYYSQWVRYRRQALSSETSDAESDEPAANG